MASKCKTRYLYVFDYCAKAIYEIELDEKDKYPDAEEILERRGLKDTQCEWMFSDEKLNIETIDIK